MRALLLVSIALLSSCALVSTPEQETKKQVISKVPDVPRSATSSGATILVLAPEAASAYDTSDMAYTNKPYQVEYFARNEWADKPARMIQGLLAQTLRTTGHFKDVYEAPYVGEHRYALRSELVELRQDFSGESPTLRLSMRMNLVDGKSNKVLASRELSTQEPMKEKSPYAGVVAANDATARLLLDAARFVVQGAR